MSLDSILTAVEAQLDWAHDLYRDLHRHPEISMQESWTRARIVKELTDIGVKPIVVGDVGVVAVIANGAGKTFLARADFDALPVTEDTGLPYASEIPGVMHACGHDTHVTALLGATKLLNYHKNQWGGTYIALFQPGEETAAGAQAMLDAGLVDLIPKPDCAYAQHVLVQPAGTVGMRKGAILSAADSIKITVYGVGAHGSMPHLSVDPVVLASSIVLRLQAVVAREVSPFDFSVVTVGAIHAGTKSNIIADHAELLLNLRHYDETVRNKVKTAIERIVRAECAASGSPKEPEFEYYDQFPLTSNNSDLVDKFTPTFTSVFGDDFIEVDPVTASEDFSEIPDAFGIPYVYATFGGVDPEVLATANAQGRSLPANHSPQFAPVMEPTLSTGIKAQVVAAYAILGID